MKALAEWKAEEKIKAFDKMFGYAQEVMAGSNGGPRVKDAEHYAFEMVMELLGDDVWKFYGEENE